jgi:aromatic-L-amino-acid/L-tryptophan decarboxylase
MLYLPNVDPVAIHVTADPFDENDRLLEIHGHDQSVAVALDIEHNAIGCEIAIGSISPCRATCKVVSCKIHPNPGETSTMAASPNDNSKTKQPPARDLDPADWGEFRRLAHGMLDDMIDHVETIRERPVWQPAPAATRDRFDAPLPHDGRGLEAVLEDVREHVTPYTTGNVHPRFMGWVHGAGTPVGMVAEMVAAGLNMNCGGRDHIGIEIERQITRWLAQAVGLPHESSGIFVTGSSMANFLAVITAKTHVLGVEARHQGLRNQQLQLTAYASDEAHGCVAQAMELAGLGSNYLRRVPATAAGCMDAGELAAAIARDRSAGNRPFLVVGTAGSVNTGAIDPLDALARIAARETLWFHVDGAFGALAILSPKLRPLLAGIERADSIAFDFHKWGHVPYDAGFLLVRDAAAHKRAFASPAAYLQRAPRGLAAGDTWPNDLGPDLSRGARALKTWMTIATLGADRIGDAILSNCELAQYLAQRIQQQPSLELKAPVALNIVCFGVRGAHDGAINREIVMDLHEAGIAAPSWTTIGGQSVIRCALVNHRTTRADIDIVVEAIVKIGAERAVEKPL